MKSLIKSILKFTSFVIVLFIAIVMLINTSPFDEELNPEIKKIMQDVSMPVVEGNAYYALMGLSADKDKDMVEVGYKLILRYLENRKKGNDEITISDYKEILGTKNPNNSSEWQNNFKFCNAKKDLDCLTQLSQAITDEFLIESRLKTMLSRYNKIIQMKTFGNFLDTTWNTPLISYSKMLNLSQIQMAAIYRPQYRSEFLFHLNKDMQFWKMHLEQGKYLLDKMVAFAAIRNDLHYLSEYMRKNEIVESNYSQIKDILTPLSKQDLDLSISFINESRSIFNTGTSMDTGSSLLENLFSQPNATSNAYYELNLKEQLQQSKLSIAELIKQRKNNGRLDKSGFKLHYLYNFFGKTLVDLSSCACSDYIVRGHNLINIFKMVNIQFQAKQPDIQSVQQLLSKQNNFNPIDNKPFEYNEENKQLQFECLDKHGQCKIQL